MRKSLALALLLLSSPALAQGTGVNFGSTAGTSGGPGGAVTSVYGRTGAVAAQTGDYVFSQIGSLPTTLAGYGITDGMSTALLGGKIFVGNGSNIATAVNLSGDATISNTGAITFATVNGNVGTFGDATHCITGLAANAKGLITAISQGTSCPGGSGGYPAVTSTTPGFTITGSGTAAITIDFATSIITDATSTRAIGASDAGYQIDRTYTVANFTDTLVSAATMGQRSFKYCAGPVAGAKDATINVATSGAMQNGQFNSPGALKIPGNTCAQITSDGSNYSVFGLGTIRAGSTFVANGTISSLLTLDALGILQTLTALPAVNFPALTGDITTPGGSLAATLATVNGNVGTFGDATHVAQVTYDGKGRATAVASIAISASGGGGGIVGYSDNSLTLTAGTYYAPVQGGGLISSTEATVQAASPSAATVVNGYACLSSDPGAGQNLVVTYRIAGVDKALTFTVTGGSGACSPIGSSSVATAQGDKIDWKIVTTGTWVGTFNLQITSNFGTANVGMTSYNVTVPSFLTATGCSTSTSATCAITLATQTAATLFAGPCTGGALAPTFRALCLTDIPAIGADNLLMNVTGGSASPTAVSIPNSPTGLVYNTTAHTWAAYPGPQTLVVNNYYTAVKTSYAATGVGSVTITRWGPFFVQQPQTWSAICARVVTAGSTNFQIGIYASGADGLATGPNLITSTNIADTSGNTNACQTGLSLAFSTPGKYWAGFQVNDTAATFWGLTANADVAGYSTGTATLANITQGSAAQLYHTSTSVFSTWASSPTLADTNNNSGVPLLIYKVSSIP